MQECVSEFISFITSEGAYWLHLYIWLFAVSLSCWHAPPASEKCQQEKRKTVNGEDILFAMTSLGFENYGEALKIYLARYREVSNFRDSASDYRPSSTNTDNFQNLVARGEHQRPGQPGTEGEAGSTYDSSNSAAVLGNPMDPSSEGATDFAGYSVAHQPEY
jgi:nuclear transcription Y subunit beta